MKSSSISLYYEESANKEKSEEKDEYLINIIDSPGHIDFSSDVSTAVRMCDGAIIIIDVVEGIRSQTQSVFHQAWNENIKPVLVLNKMDRLVSELKLSPQEAYDHCRQIIESANAIMSSLMSADSFEKDEILSENDETNLFFSPSKCNILFSSAVDGWAFSVGDFAKFYSPILNEKSNYLRYVLWGNYGYNTTIKKFVKLTDKSKILPAFVKFILTPIWNMYNLCLNNDIKLKDYLKKYKVEVPEKELNSDDKKSKINSIFRRWLPLSDSTLHCIIKHIPCPLNSMKDKIEAMWPKQISKSEKCEIAYNSICKSVNNENDPVIIYISKIFTTPIKGLPKLPPNESDYSGDDECYVAFARVFSGILTEKSKLYAIYPKYNPFEPNGEYIKEIESKFNLYTMMGKDLVSIDKVMSGNIVGIIGLSEYIMKTGTVSSIIECPPLSNPQLRISPIISVSVEPKSIDDLSILNVGLKLLERSDPCVEVEIQSSGEHIIRCVGEVHLERCLKDLKEKYAKIELVVSPPIVNYMETVELLPALKEGESKRIPNAVSVITPNKRLKLTIRALPIPRDLSVYLQNHENELSNLILNIDNYKDIKENKYYLELKNEFEKNNYLSEFNEILSFGPKRIGPNILINKTGESSINVWNNNIIKSEKVELNELNDNLLEKYISSIIDGFELACLNGPLCEEPMWGVCFVLEELIDPSFINTNNNCSEIPLSPCTNNNNPLSPCISVTSSELSSNIDSYGSLSGQIISRSKECCRNAFMQCSSRLVERYLKCELQCNDDQLGKLYGVFNKKRGKILSEDIWEGTNIFTISALIPMNESIGLASSLIDATSGGASHPQLVFSHWEILDIDPYFKPTSEEDIEEYGSEYGEKNLGKMLVDEVKIRKGLLSDRKIIKDAEKQRTLSKKK